MSRLVRLLHSFDQKRDAHAAADAEGGEAVARASLVHLVEEGGGDAHTRAADGVAERDGAAVNVEARGVEPKLAVAGDDLRGEGLVKLDEVNLVEREVLSFQQAAHG